LLLLLVEAPPPPPLLRAAATTWGSFESPNTNGFELWLGSSSKSTSAYTIRAQPPNSFPTAPRAATC
jgi:hypothetical protein